MTTQLRASLTASHALGHSVWEDQRVKHLPVCLKMSPTSAAMILIAAITAFGCFWGLLLTDRLFFDKAALTITCLGVAVALVIYRRQTIENAATEERIVNSFERTEIERSKRFAIQAEELSPQSQKDQYPEAAEMLIHLGKKLDDQFNLLTAKEVPFQVIGDLVGGWTNEGKTGRWTMGDLRWAIRKTGRGNHPWIVTFYDPEEKRYRSWRVSRGGQGKKSSSVSEMSDA